ncbi:MAG: slipin family protein [Gammaproteobacteria bacterium]|nr:slipin family protein [Gammaproteobacteria bacterium]
MRPERHILWIFRKFIVRKNERGLLFKDGDFQTFLESGYYRRFDLFHKLHVEIFDLSVPEFEHRLTDFLLKTYPEVMERYFIRIELNARQVALLYKNERLADVLPPATRKFYWRDVVDIRADIRDISDDYEIPADTAALLMHNKLEGRETDAVVYSREVPEYCLGVLYVDGQCVKTLPAGLHAYWRFNRSIRMEIVDTRLQETEISGQEILTRDKVNLRVTLSATYVFEDVLRTLSALPRPADYLYKALQFGLRAAVGTRTLDELLEDKSAIDEQVLAYAQEKAGPMGIAVRNVGVKDIILPGEMKAILSKVVEAEKAAQANLIRRREETAATRSLLNTAKVMEGNPTALRLKELETLEKVTEKIGSLSVYGGLEGLLKELVKIK